MNIYFKTKKLQKHCADARVMIKEFGQRMKGVHTPGQALENGGIDHQQVTEIEVIAIEDTHDKKNQRKGS
jgi:hypothetical protein